MSDSKARLDLNRVPGACSRDASSSSLAHSLLPLPLLRNLHDHDLFLLPEVFIVLPPTAKPNISTRGPFPLLGFHRSFQPPSLLSTTCPRSREASAERTTTRHPHLRLQRRRSGRQRQRARAREGGRPSAGRATPARGHPTPTPTQFGAARAGAGRAGTGTSRAVRTVLFYCGRVRLTRSGRVGG